MLKYTHIETCSNCDADIEIFVESHEFADVPETCDSCDYKFSEEEQSKFFDRATEAFVDHWADYAADYNR